MSRPGLVAAALLVATATLPAVAASPSSGHGAPAGVWVAGDLHVHTIYGHDTCVTPTEAWDPSSTSRDARRSCPDSYTVGFTPTHRLQEALDRGLDFVAITDHNNVVNQSDPEEVAWLQAHPQLIYIPGYENSQPGHVQMLGARSCISPQGPTTQTIECDQLVSPQDESNELALAAALHAAGGVFQVNHPSDGNWDSHFHHEIVPDTVEVWNIGPWAYQHPFPASNDNDFSLDWYDQFLLDHHEVGVTGGSDTHWVTTDAAQGVGEPTTWVLVRDRTEQGVLRGLMEHHTFVSALPPALGGPQLYLEADRNHDGNFDAVVGDEVGGTAAYRVRTVGAAPGSLLRIVTDGGRVDVPLPASGELDFTPGAGGVPTAHIFVRVELLVPDARDARTASCDPVVGTQSTVCRDDLAMEALTSPIFVEPGDAVSP